MSLFSIFIFFYINKTMVARCQHCKKNKGPGHVCPPPQPVVGVNGPFPPLPRLGNRIDQYAVGGHLPVNQQQVLPPGGIFNPNRFRRNKSTKKSLRKSKPKKSLRKSKPKKSLRKSKPKKSLRKSTKKSKSGKYNRRI
jgi:hypothetical protein